MGSDLIFTSPRSRARAAAKVTTAICTSFPHILQQVQFIVIAAAAKEIVLGKVNLSED